MSRFVRFALVPLILLALVGCQTTGKTACNYCPVEQKLLGQTGTVHCDKCNKDMPAGKWCSKCNRIMLPGTVYCDKCKKDMPKGAYCPCCKQYVGVPNVAYCEACKAPYDKKKGCPTCKPCQKSGEQ